MKFNIAGKEIVIDKKFLIMNLPLVAIWYVLDKMVWLYRTTEGDASAKMQALVMNMNAAFAPPWPSFHPVDIIFGIAVIALIKFMMNEKKKNAKKWRHGEEYGSARWGTKEDIKPYMSEDPWENVILTQTEGLTMGKPESPKYARNKNVLIIGGSGSGKTRFFVKPNLMQMHSSYVITDPKGTILEECGHMLQIGPPKVNKQGNICKDKSGNIIHQPYKIKVFNTINFAKSNHYNPFAYISKAHPEKDILSLVNTIILNTKGEGSQAGEDFWVKAERLLYSAYIGYIYYEVPKDERNFITLLEMIDESECKEDDENFKNAIDMLFEKLEKRDPNHFAVRQYKKYKLAAGKTAKSIMISCGARLACFDIQELRELTKYDEMELDKLGERLTAMFVIISDTDDTFNFLVAIMYTQMFRLLCEKADNEYHGKLPKHVRVICDEFANIGQIPKFDKLIATIRSREISACVILQAKSQLKSIYKDNADTIEGNCDTTLFLGGKEKTTLKGMSEMLGKETIDMFNTSESRGQSSSSSTSFQKVGKDLMSQDELAVMDGGKCILQVRGVRPFFSDKFDITQHPNYNLLSDYDEKNFFDIEKYVKNSFREGTRLKMKPSQKLNVVNVGVIKGQGAKANSEVAGN